MLNPGVFVLARRFDRCGADVAHMAEAIGEPVDMLLDRLDHARQHRRAAGTRDHEQVRKAFRRNAEIGAGAGLPFFGERAAIAAGDAYLVERARHRGKAGGGNDRVERILDAANLDAICREALDRRLGNVDQFHMRQIVGFEIAGIDTEALAAEYILGTQQLGGGRILDDAADLPAGEVGDGVVGCLLEQQIAEGAEEGQAAAFPGLFVLPLALFRRAPPARAWC